MPKEYLAKVISSGTDAESRLVLRFGILGRIILQGTRSPQPMKDLIQAVILAPIDIYLGYSL